MNENLEKPQDEWKEKAKPLLERRKQILSKLTLEEREELAELEEEIRKLTQPNF